ncbi:galactose-3-O-sulfotransferase 4 [Gracilinanus agilis]|uniref:galactose-3-O-sulfotransferase 4 n=1 Tax=Gracilinanus agilis TaxID=191870 RepID=UPI001CFF4580|nr:galactose-3-O-sulfotransferase 4 [Gracilinanus agilis]
MLQKYFCFRIMRLWLWGSKGLWAALVVFVTIGLAFQIWRGPFQKRPPGLYFPQLWTSTSDSPGSSLVPSCHPQQQLVFLKTHKSGSSSVLSLLHQYGDRHSLRFALPVRYQFGYPKSFQATTVKGYLPHGGGPQPAFHILCHHMRFNLPEVLRVMPSDSFFFSIVRDPAAVAISAFSYYKSVSSAFRAAPSLAAFLASPRAFYRQGGRGDHYARNLLWFDFGLPLPREMRALKRHPKPLKRTQSSGVQIWPSSSVSRPSKPDPNSLLKPPSHPKSHVQSADHSMSLSPSATDSVSSSFIQWALAWLDSTFDLVLVAEYFDESLVLLADALCWGLDDVVGFVHNAQATGMKSVKGHKEVKDQGEIKDKQMIARARAWNNLDWALYVHFNHSLWDRADRYGRVRLASAVAKLRARRSALASRCLLGGGAVDPSQIADLQLRPFQFGARGVLGYVLRKGLTRQDQEECERLATPELQYKDKLDAKQFPKAVQSLSPNATNPGPKGS